MHGIRVQAGGARRALLGCELLVRAWVYGSVSRMLAENDNQ